MLEFNLGNIRRIAIVVWTSLQLFKESVLSVSVSIDKQILDSAPKAEMFDVFHVMPEGDVKVMTELDLLLTIDQYRELYMTQKRIKRKAKRDLSTRWTDCKVFYEITSSIPVNDHSVILEAIAEWEKYTCLAFVDNKFANRRIQFQDGGGCYSQLGMQDKPQPLVLARGCRTKGVIAHEIGHAIGWYHEHMRPDRDQFISVNFDAIPMRYKGNFIKYTGNDVNTYGIPYDYTSLMHYGNDALPGSISTLDPRFQDKIGQRNGMTFKDIKLANVMYNCARLMGCMPQTCKYDGFVFYKDYKGEGKCQCWCDSGTIEDPLVLCSKLDKAPPPPPRPIPTITPVVKVCYDVREDCFEMKEQGMCMSKMDLMMDACAKTCNFCGKGENMCMDHEKGCALMAASGRCTDPGLELMMRTMCPASCGLCSKPPDPCEIQRELMGSDHPGNGGATVDTGLARVWVLVTVVVPVLVVSRDRIL